MNVNKAQSQTSVETPNGNAVISIATPSRGAHEVSIVQQIQQPGGFNPEHRHDREEVMVMQSGVVTLLVDGVEHLLEAGDTAIVPAEAAHQITNRNSAPASWMLVAPAGIKFFAATGEQMTPGWAQ